MSHNRLGRMEYPADLDDDVHGTIVTRDECEGIGTARMGGRWTGLYRQMRQRWHLVAVFPSRKVAQTYFGQIADGKTYALAALRGTLEPVVQIA